MTGRIADDERADEASYGQADVAALMGRTAARTGRHVTWDQAVKPGFRFVQDIDTPAFETPAPIREGSDGIHRAPLPGATKEI